MASSLTTIHRNSQIQVNVLPRQTIVGEKGEERMATIVTSYNQKVKEELERDIDMRNWQNENQPVYTRQMTAEEMAAIFGGNPNAIKNISRNSDEKEWRRIK